MSTVPLKQIAILGSTGSIGRQTLDVIRSLPERFKATVLAAGSNAELLAQQATEFGSSTVVLANTKSAKILDNLLPNPVERFFGSEHLETISVREDVDIVVVAVDGAIGIKATVAALLAGKTVALATKEVLVAAGEIVTKAARIGGGSLVPIDSEHSAVLQCIQGAPINSIYKIWLTASGGPFRGWSLDQLANAKVEDALKHPTWQMGRKITVDSATMMNKGLEAIEAQWLFGLSVDQVSIVVHPQSTVHALVQFQDGATMAQLGHADMRLPIEYALLGPERIDIGISRLDILALGKLEFEPPDEVRFPCLRLANKAARRGGTAPAVLNAANEAAVALFLSDKLSFLGIPKVVELALEYHNSTMEPTLDQILSADAWARHFVSEVATP